MKKQLALLLIAWCSMIRTAKMDLHDKIYVAGHTGLVGSAIVRALDKAGYCNIVTRTSDELDLRDREQVNQFFSCEKPAFVFLAAARVGGIKANIDYPAQFIYDNIMIECNVIDAAYHYGVRSLLFLGSSCIYPRDCPQPIKEEYLLQGALESTNEPYAIAKITGIKMCHAYNKQYGTDFIACMPTNLYGPNDNFDRQTAHVLPGLIAAFIEAQDRGDTSVTLWGTGKPRREFLFVDDCAEAMLFLMNNYSGNEIFNIGVGDDVSIKELAHCIKAAVGYEGAIQFDPGYPDGTPRKWLNVDKIHQLGWRHSTSLNEGVEKTVAWYRNHGSCRQRGK